MPSSPIQPRMSAIVLAGERKPDNDLLNHTGASCKALIEIEHVPMLLRVIYALDQSRQVDTILLSGPQRTQLRARPDLNALVDSGKIHWHEPGPTPSTSAYQVMQTLHQDTPVLVTTADLPLLSTDIIDDFCSQSLNQEVDVSVGLASYDLARQAFPEMKKTVLRFKGGHYCSCNLFAFTTERGRQMADYWRQVEKQRKKPWRVIGLLGWRAVIAYLLGLLTLERAFTILSQRLGFRIGAVILPQAHAAIDIDSVSDYILVSKKMAETRNTV